MTVKDINRAEAKKMIVDLVNKGAISFTKHAEQRMQERHVTLDQVRNCLLRGKLAEDPYHSNTKNGGFVTTVERLSEGRWLRVVIDIKLHKKLIIITVIRI